MNRYVTAFTIFVFFTAFHAQGQTKQVEQIPSMNPLSKFNFLLGKWTCTGEETYTKKKKTTKFQVRTEMVAEFRKQTGWISVRYEMADIGGSPEPSFQDSFIGTDPNTKNPVAISVDSGQHWDVEKSDGWNGSEVSFKAAHTSRNETAWTKLVKNSDDSFELNCGFESKERDTQQTCNKKCLRAK